MRWPDHLIGAASVTAMVLGILLMAYSLQPTPANVVLTGPVPPEHAGCLKSGRKLVVDFRMALVTCEDP